MDGTASAAQHSSLKNSSDGLIVDFIAAALAWGAAGIPQLVFAYVRWAAGATPQEPPLLLLFGFAIDVLLAAALFMASRNGSSPLRGRGAIRLVFWCVQGLLLAASLGFSLGLNAGAAWLTSSSYGAIWALVPLVFLAALLPDCKPLLLPAGWFVLAALLCLALAQLEQAFDSPVLAGCSSNWACAELLDRLKPWLPVGDIATFAFILGSLGVLYHFMAQRTGRPAAVQGLAAAHFTAFVFLYVAAGAKPELPAAALVLTALCLLAVPAIAWTRLRSDAAVRFFALAAVLYATAALNAAGKQASARAANSLLHYTTRIVQHVDPTSLGLALAASCGAIYCLAPQLLGRRELYSMRLAFWHFWLFVLGTLLCSNFLSAAAQLYMWKAFDRGFLDYEFVQSIDAIRPYLVLRAAGGTLLAAGWAAMIYNVWRTAGSARR